MTPFGLRSVPINFSRSPFGNFSVSGTLSGLAKIVAHNSFKEIFLRCPKTKVLLRCGPTLYIDTSDQGCEKRLIDRVGDSWSIVLWSLLHRKIVFPFLITNSSWKQKWEIGSVTSTHALVIGVEKETRIAFPVVLMRFTLGFLSDNVYICLAWLWSALGFRQIGCQKFKSYSLQGSPSIWKKKER